MAHNNYHSAAQFLSLKTPGDIAPILSRTLRRAQWGGSTVDKAFFVSWDCIVLMVHQIRQMPITSRLITKWTTAGRHQKLPESLKIECVTIIDIIAAPPTPAQEI
ncbi:hypothetical protein TNCV_2164921 [Trichonephila clavipes]|nr:hypothetical protein TNCV_2164921 [Trichonephila clavipes]